MSKLLNKYNELKKKDDSSIYIFRSGIFYNCINDDAKLLNEKLGLKLSNLSPDIEKCGFPLKSLEKFKEKMNSIHIKYEIIDELPESTINEYYNNIELKKIVNQIKSIDINNTSPIDAINILNDFQKKINNI